MNFEILRPIAYKVRSKDRQLWYGTFKTLEEAEKHMKKNWPNVTDFEIITVNV